ncbi:DMT family transporter [Geodermatophilus sp. YIM 151500]|uniref:DMT family transporter n=1 Tax=Geodermatophilus sp. YIM 151500 TaxID=2984531 RepID=UPI0021E39654|nr:DMT family transporter [Geodermatophilus sp. YIM 151500]MCV2491912.1 DMT family transporter [Geodermatophilus sp. YIM 151500]
MAVLLALLSSLVYGAADFCGGLATRRATALAVVAVSQAAGLVALLLLLPLLGGDPTGADLAWGAGAGIAGGGALVLFYRALAGGVMSVVAPVTGVCGAAVPVVVGVGLGERLHLLAAVGIGLALVAVALVAAEGGLPGPAAVRSAGLLPALAAGAGFGLFFVLLDRTHPGSGLWPLAGARVASIALVVAVALAVRTALRVPRSVLPLVLLAGSADITANALFLLAAQQGQLAVTGVLASLYPASTVLLAQLVLRERLARTQLAGLGTAAVAVVLISLPG